MRAVFVSEITGHVFLSLDMTKQELISCSKGDENAVQRVVDGILEVCREAKALPEPAATVLEPVEQEKAMEPEKTVELQFEPFHAKHYKGVQIGGYSRKEKGSCSEETIKERLLDAVIEKNNIYISQEQVDSETEFELCRRFHNNRYERLVCNDNDYDAEVPREEVEREVIREIKIDKLLKSIIEQEKITATREELENEAVAMAQRMEISEDMVKQFFGEDLAFLEKDVLREKAVNFIFENAVFIDPSDVNDQDLI